MSHPERWCKAWTKREKTFLAMYYGDLEDEAIASQLKRTIAAIRREANQLHLRKSARRVMPSVDKPWWVSEYVVDYYRKNGV